MEHICWDDDQIEHIAEHGVTVDEWEYVYDHFLGQDVSESTGRPIRFGYTATGRFVLVIYEVDEIEGVLWISPVTAYEVPEPTWRLSDE